VHSTTFLSFNFVVFVLEIIYEDGELLLKKNGQAFYCFVGCREHACKALCVETGDERWN